MDENKPILELTKKVAITNWFAWYFLLEFGLLYNYRNASIPNLLLYFLPFIVSFASLFPLLYKKYIYKESILNTVSKKVLIAFMTCSIVGGLLPIIPVIILGIIHLLTDTSLHIVNILFYIGVALLLLSILSQIYYFSRMKITYFLILLLGVFVLEYIILSYYPIWTANG
ncbi:MAG: hypothetical protein K6343_03115, partial [Caldisericaceae bacterium]